VVDIGSVSGVVAHSERREMDGMGLETWYYHDGMALYYDLELWSMVMYMDCVFTALRWGSRCIACERYQRRLRILTIRL